MSQIPTEKDWIGYEKDLDAKYAYKTFYGKTNEEMQSAFRYNVIERVDEIRFMPRGAFQYYIFGLRDYVIRQDFGFYDSSDAASCFINLILEKLRKDPEFIRPIISDLLPDLEFVAENQKLYEADGEIYGDFRVMYRDIVRLLGASAYPRRSPETKGWDGSYKRI
uniref:hypothetical protein n=1 Tax=Candidatus Electrothrix sp. TaxID=2170559 RepID=UPI0040566737